MVNTIWKYELSVLCKNELMIPQGGKILSLQMQCEEPCIWVQVDPDATLELRVFRIVGTGQKWSVPVRDTYIGTVQQGVFVWHCFEEESTIW